MLKLSLVVIMSLFINNLLYLSLACLIIKSKIRLVFDSFAK